MGDRSADCWSKGETAVADHIHLSAADSMGGSAAGSMVFGSATGPMGGSAADSMVDGSAVGHIPDSADVVDQTDGGTDLESELVI